MRIVQDPIEMQSIAEELRRNGKRIGLVPTMGHLHDGHLSLVRISKARTDFTVVSIFVNPTQFGPNEDFERYPRDADRDQRLLEQEEADLLFLPTLESLYPPDHSTVVRVENLGDRHCGASRPWHFPGVSLIVCKLFNIAKPHVAVFGQKDYQQAAIIKRMVRDLNFDIEILVEPIVRDVDGIAMSSRNAYLSEEERGQAVCLSEALKEANRLYLLGERNGKKLMDGMRAVIQGRNLVKIDYVDVVDSETLESVEKADGESVALLAVHVGKARLIDNHILGEPFPGVEDAN